MTANILMIMSDEHRSDAMGCAGNSAIHTPHLDRLAQRGVVFDNTYCQGPLCQPARASLLTGKYAGQHGLLHNGVEFDPNWDTIPKRLQASGYFTGYIGKTHFTHSGLKKEGSDLRDLAPWSSLFGFDTMWEEFDKNQHRPGYRTHYTEYLKSLGLYENYLDDMAKRTAWREGSTSTIPQEHDLTSFTGAEAVRWLHTFDKDQPYFLWVSFVAPHPPFIADSQWTEYYKELDVPLGSRELPARNPEIYDEYLQALGRAGLFVPEGDDYVRQSTRQYYGMISLIDQQVGNILDALREVGHEEDTWVLYSADHGEMLGDHGLWGKCVFNAASVKVPTIVRPPGGTSSHHVVDPTEAIDLSATILDIAGNQDPNVSGSSLVNSVLDGQSSSKMSVAYSELDAADDIRSGTWSGSKPLSFVTVATDRYRYTVDRFSGSPCELFDLTIDPGENENLVLDASARAVCEDLRSEYLEPFLKDSQVS